MTVSIASQPLNITLAERIWFMMLAIAAEIQSREMRHRPFQSTTMVHKEKPTISLSHPNRLKHKIAVPFSC